MPSSRKIGSLPSKEMTPSKPTPAEVIAARKAAGLTQTKAAALVYATCRAWQLWEAGDRQMDRAHWELFRIKCQNAKAL
jgi:DNA-binding transcriptional regulator YiaG